MKLSTRVAHERLTRICFIDYDREMALVAERQDPEADGGREILGVGRLSKLRGTDEAEFALLIADSSKGRDSAPRCSTACSRIGRDEKIARIAGSSSPRTSDAAGSARSWASACRTTSTTGWSRRAGAVRLIRPSRSGFPAGPVRRIDRIGRSQAGKPDATGTSRVTP